MVHPVAKLVGLVQNMLLQGCFVVFQINQLEMDLSHIQWETLALYGWWFTSQDDHFQE